MTIITIGIDLAKNIFAVHGVNQAGKPELLKPKVSRDQLMPLIANLPPCLIGMEACSGAHHWARQFQQYGHTVRLIALKFVTPYRMTGKRGKNDAADAAAICEAVTRPQMLFVPIKDEHQQATLTLHRTRQGKESGGATRLLVCGHCHRRQECALVLGGVEIWRGLQAVFESGLINK